LSSLQPTVADSPSISLAHVSVTYKKTITTGSAHTWYIKLRRDNYIC